MLARQSSVPNKMSKKAIINFIGFVVVVVSFYFVLDVLWNNWELIADWRPSMGSMALFVVSAVIYGLSQLILSGAWGELLTISGEAEVDLKKCHLLYGQTQIAKYIPGNIFHFAGRQIRGKELGYTHAALASASIYESLGLVVVASAISVIGITGFGLEQDVISSGYLIAVFVCSVIAFAAGIVVVPRFVKTVNAGDTGGSYRRIGKSIRKVAWLYALFFLVSGSLLVAVVASQVNHVSFGNMGVIVVVCIFSWIAGFVTPAAPAGAGVREAIIIMFLTQLVGGSVAVISALIYRCITVGGDAMFYLGSRMFKLS